MRISLFTIMIKGGIIKIKSRRWFIFHAFLFNWLGFSWSSAFVVFIYCLDDESFHHFAYWVWYRKLFSDIDYQALKVWYDDHRGREWPWACAEPFTCISFVFFVCCYVIPLCFQVYSRPYTALGAKFMDFHGDFSCFTV